MNAKTNNYKNFNIIIKILIKANTMAWKDITLINSYKIILKFKDNGIGIQTIKTWLNSSEKWYKIYKKIKKTKKKGLQKHKSIVCVQLHIDLIIVHKKKNQSKNQISIITVNNYALYVMSHFFKSNGL
jgi:predicted acetyltransferase